MRGLFVTGTDTGVGKSVVAAAITAALSVAGRSPLPLKPLLTGLDDPPENGWPYDHELLASAAELAPEAVVLERFGPPVSPHLAAELAGQPVDVPALVRQIQGLAADRVAVVEGVGGVLVPLGEGWDVRRLARELGLAVVIAARPGLGTINHTLLTLEAARAVGLQVAGVVLTPWPTEPSAMERSNRESIERLGSVSTAGLPFVERADRAALAEAGRRLPLAEWLGEVGT